MSGRSTPGAPRWALIKGGHEPSPTDRAALDIWYVRHASVRAPRSLDGCHAENTSATQTDGNSAHAFQLYSVLIKRNGAIHPVARRKENIDISNI
jgi:hypothetical protein